MNVYDGAAREGWEESMGFLGSRKDLYHKIIKSNNICIYDNAILFLVEIKFDDKISYSYESIYNYVMRSYPKGSLKGFYEKVNIDWFYPSDITYHKNEMRPAFLKFFTKVLVNIIK